MVKNITKDFKKLIKDLMTDLLNTFPEYRDKFTEDELEFLKESGDEKKMDNVFNYLKHKSSVFKVDEYYSWGTPQELKNYHEKI